MSLEIKLSNGKLFSLIHTGTFPLFRPQLTFEVWIMNIIIVGQHQPLNLNIFMHSLLFHNMILFFFPNAFNALQLRSYVNLPSYIIFILLFLVELLFYQKWNNAFVCKKRLLLFALKASSCRKDVEEDSA